MIVVSSGKKMVCIEVDSELQEVLSHLKMYHGSEERAIREAILLAYGLLFAEGSEKLREILFRELLRKLAIVLLEYEEQLKDYPPYTQLKNSIEATLKSLSE